MADPQVYQAFVNGGFKRVFLAADMDEVADHFAGNLDRQKEEITKLSQTLASADAKIKEQLSVLATMSMHVSVYRNETRDYAARLLAVNEELRIANEAHERQAASIRGYQAREKELEGQIAIWRSHGYPSERLTAVEKENATLRGNSDRQAETIKKLMKDNEKLEEELRVERFRPMTMAHMGHRIAELEKAANAAIEILGDVV